ncbi:hypothetical protein I553_9996 [Mycobacterium xenopi 4042]|uniref:Uncharacterized protein n=1 Tax=Mycobacterium xenopi 4042 TaxID=1299334 RepID=X7YPA6_MYCXE|nr:hypothetical protein I553_9996 [Mycobacterium xenopi 4042]
MISKVVMKPSSLLSCFPRWPVRVRWLRSDAHAPRARRSWR